MPRNCNYTYAHTYTHTPTLGCTHCRRGNHCIQLAAVPLVREKPVSIRSTVHMRAVCIMQLMTLLAPSASSHTRAPERCNRLTNQRQLYETRRLALAERPSAPLGRKKLFQVHPSAASCIACIGSSIVSSSVPLSRSMFRKQRNEPSLPRA